MILLFDKFLSSKMRTKISLTIFFIILLFAVSIGFSIKNLIIKKTNHIIENSIQNMVQLNEDIILKNLLEQNYWDIFKLMRSFSKINLIKSATFVDQYYNVIASSKPNIYPIGYKMDKKNIIKNKTLIIPLESENIIFGYFIIDKEFKFLSMLTRDIKYRIMLSIVLAALIAIIVGFIISKRIVKRLELLSQNAKMIEEQKWSEIVEIKYIEKDEITELSNTTTQMVHKIKTMLEKEQTMKLFYHNILKNLNALIIICDNDYNIIFNNSNKLKNLIIENKQLKKIILESIKKKMHMENENIILELENEQSKTLYLQLSIINVSNNIVISFSNVTALKRMEEKILFKHSFEIVGEISSEVVHEIKNYLQPIKILLEQDKVDEEDKQRVLQIVHKINTIVQSFLTRGKSVEKDLLIEIPLKEKIENILYIFIERLEQKQIHVETNLDALLSIDMAASNFDSILTNLLSNAIEACQNNGVIKINCIEDTRNIILEISNTGESIDKELIKNIHKPFFTTKKSGSGMGLYIVYKIVYLYGGFIVIDSNNEYTQFSIHFPKRR